MFETGFNGGFLSVERPAARRLPAQGAHEDQAAPQPLVDFVVELDCPYEIQQAWVASPDEDSNQARPMKFTQHPGSIQVEIPRLDFWSVLFLEAKQPEVS